MGMRRLMAVCFSLDPINDKQNSRLNNLTELAKNQYSEIQPSSTVVNSYQSKHRHNSVLTAATGTFFNIRRHVMPGCIFRYLLQN